MELQPVHKKIVQQVMKLGITASIAIIVAPVAVYFIGRFLFGRKRTITSLPIEIVFQISKFLDEQSLSRLSQTNKYLHDLVNNEESVWKNHFIEHWPKRSFPRQYKEPSFGAHFRFLVQEEKKRLDFKPYQFALSIVGSKLEDQLTNLDEWKAKIIEELKDLNISLKDGEIIKGGLEIIGRYRFLSVDDGFSKFKSCSWIHEKYECPFSSDIIGSFLLSSFLFAGFLNFEFNDWKLGDVDVDDEEWKDAFTDCIRAFAYGESGGILARLENNTWVQTIHLIEISIEEAFSKGGFSHGDELLSAESSSEYIQKVLTECQDLLNKNNISGKPIYMNTHTHNPLRIENQDSKTMKEEELGNINIKLWVHNLEVVKNNKILFWL